MYGTAGSSTYADTHANVNDSTIKRYLDTWYTVNLFRYEDKLADAIYCNDRTVVKFTYNDFDEGDKTFNGNGVGTEETAYAGFKKNLIDHTPSLTCTNNNDKFTKSNTLGNGKLSNPIGLLTLDEYLMAGVGSDDYNTGNIYGYMNNTGAFYLYDSGNWYWSMTPVQMYSDENASVGCLMNYSFINASGADNPDIAVRPVVSLKSSSITGGTGTSADPFVVGGTNDTPICLKGEGC